MTSLSLAAPARKLDSPTEISNENSVCMRGLRMSASIKTTLQPVCISEIARLIAVVVLPSLGAALVTSIVLGGRPEEESNKDVRTERYASAINEDGELWTMRSAVPVPSS